MVVQHNKDCRKPTNTVRILTRCLTECEVTRYAVRGASFDASALTRDPDIAWCLLFPTTEAGDLPEAPPALSVEGFRRPPVTGRRRGVVVVDGTWAQARRMRRRLPSLRAMPTFELPPGPPTRWNVRTQSEAGRMSTAEAAIRGLAICEGAPRLRPLKRYFNEVSARMMYMKSRLPSPEVPTDWSDEVCFDDPAVLIPASARATGR